MFKQKVIIYISRSHLFIYFKKLSNPIKLELEQSTLFNLEEFDTNWILENLKPILSKYKIKNSEATLILGRDMVFDKILEQEESENKQQEINDFKQKIPLPQNLISVKEYLQNDNVLLVATNHDIYTSLISLFEKFDIQIKYVLPEVVFNTLEYNKSFLNELYKQKDLLRYGNFIESKDSNGKTTKTTILISGLIFILLGYFGIANFNNIKSIFNINIQQLISSNEPQQEQLLLNDNQENNIQNQDISDINDPQEQIVKIQDIDKDLITINVLNGSGVPGFAGEISQILNSSQYLNTNPANADRYNYTNTIIDASTDIEQVVIDEIRELLKTQVKSFEIKNTVTKSNTIDLILGQPQPK